MPAAGEAGAEGWEGTFEGTELPGDPVFTGVGTTGLDDPHPLRRAEKRAMVRTGPKSFMRDFILACEESDSVEINAEAMEDLREE
jgi:hypothetical protein